jgi:hypothetical protein
MFSPMVSKANVDSNFRKRAAPEASTLVKRSAAERARTLQQATDDGPLSGSHEQHSGLSGREAKSGPLWNLGKIPLLPPERASRSASPLARVSSGPLIGAVADWHEQQAMVGPRDSLGQRKCECAIQADDITTDEETSPRRENESPEEVCGDRLCTDCLEKRDTPTNDAFSIPQKRDTAASGDGQGSALVPAQGALPAQAAHTYKALDRDSYGHTDNQLTEPSCVPRENGTSDLVAGSIAFTTTVFKEGTYRVRRDDGVIRNAICTRLPAGRSATLAHERIHQAHEKDAVAAANTAQNLPRDFVTAGECAAALPGILKAWSSPVLKTIFNETHHGPGAPRQTPTTFNEENAAGQCSFT